MLMGAAEIVAGWLAYLKAELPELSAPLVKLLASASVAMQEARSCQAGKIAAKLRGHGLVASGRRWLERWFSSGSFAAATQAGLAGAVWRRWRGAEALLLLDETAKADDLRCLKVSLAFRGRALPLAFACYRKRPGRSMVRILRDVLQRATAAAPTQARLVVVADRGLAWPALVDLCVQKGWRYLLRLQGQTKVRLPDGRCVAARDLAPKVGRPAWAGRAEVFRKAGWRAAGVVALWAKKAKEPWLLVTDLPPREGRWKTYARRMWIEQSFRDEKSHGFRWSESRVNDPRNAERLLTLMALAMLLAVSLGAWLMKKGFRHVFDPRRKRRLSLFQLGLQGLDWLLKQTTLRWRLQLCFPPP
jgi:hypothetical protein